MGSGCSGGSASQWFDAAKAGDASKLEKIAGRGFPLDDQDLLGWTAIKWAARYGNAECVRLLAVRGADLNAASPPSPAMLAAMYDHEVCVHILCEHRAYLEARDTHGRTAAMIAAQMGHERCLNILAAHGATLNATNAEGMSVAMCFLMATGQVFQPPRDLDTAIKSMRSDQCSGVATSMPSATWWTAAREGDYQALQKLMSSGMYYVDATNDALETASYLAAEGGHDPCVRLLLKSGAAPRRKVKVGRTLPMAAAKGGHESCLRLLLQEAADPTAKDSNGQTAVMFAGLEGHEQCLRVFFEEEPWKQQCVDSINAKDTAGRNAVMFAAENGWVQCVRLLVEKRADLDSRDTQGQTAAVICVASLMFSERHTSCVQLLAESGADFVSKRKADGLNALQLFEARAGFAAAASLVPTMDWKSASQSGFEHLLNMVTTTFDRGGPTDKRCLPSLHLALWAPDADDANPRPRDAELVALLAVIVEQLLAESRLMRLSKDGGRILHVILQVGLLRAVDDQRYDNIQTATNKTLSHLETILVQRQYEMQPLSKLTKEQNEYMPKAQLRTDLNGEQKLDQREAVPRQILHWLNALPDDYAKRLQSAFEVFKALGTTPTEACFRDFIARHDFPIDHTFYATAAAHVIVQYGALMDHLFAEFMTYHFGEEGRLKIGPVKNVARVIAKTEEDVPAAKCQREAAENADLRLSFCQVCDIVRCSLRADGAADMIDVVTRLRGLGQMSPKGKLEAWRLKNTHHHSVIGEDIVGGYRDVKVLGRFTAKEHTETGLPASMIVEVQVIDRVFLDVKTYMHRAYAIARGDYAQPRASHKQSWPDKSQALHTVS